MNLFIVHIMNLIFRKLNLQHEIMSEN